MTIQTIFNARSCAVDPLLGRRYAGDGNHLGNVERRKMVARSMIHWYADLCCKRFGLAESVPATQQPEQRHAREDGLRRLLQWTMNRPSPVMSAVIALRYVPKCLPRDYRNANS